MLREKHTIIYIADNGFGEYYKPAEGLFEAVADGRMLILSPWQHDPDKPHVTRAECVAMNKMAKEICEAMSNPEYNSGLIDEGQILYNKIMQNKIKSKPNKDNNKLFTL